MTPDTELRIIDREKIVIMAEKHRSGEGLSLIISTHCDLVILGFPDLFLKLLQRASIDNDKKQG